ncbi:uncharacterized protein MELLADRAFT_118089 [Melampsora larici-populina 98AG31]|uniref:OTU domain-containing protein n=1 Tax=Melampsora larici-populina (strain 98AG31 / pathotype 3-4-7) TaxID=747676 RepID=F4S502_MELLP|nr:uncharacterized protein MELLADRAFT_118089 [Melampsora larici-populina 98AG31]EGG00290.1 hypothetical protein MELLADRAFT_118089 [Melampsora larici-populina 98AG31]
MVKRESCRRSTIRSHPSSKPSSSNQINEPRRVSKGRARTRASGLKLIQDPKDDDKLLKEQLGKMGLYLSNTMGDGNCLFRALSDQSFGHEDLHDRIRQEVCDYLERNVEKYKDFVDTDEEESWETRLMEMRKLGTYGGHLELSAFANLHQRPIKVIQPGMIYIIGYEDQSASSVTSKNGKGKARHVESDGSSTSTPLYIVYHQWEHYSSVRNLAGPHSGPPQIRENLRPSSTSPKEETHFNSSHDPTQLSTELNLLRKSLPEEVSYTNQELKEMISRTGSWEKALEEVLEERVEEEESHSEQSSSSQVRVISSSTSQDLKTSLSVGSGYREPTPSSTSVTTASSPANSTAPSSIRTRSSSQLRKLSRSHSRSPEPSDSTDEGIGRRLRRRRTRSSNPEGLKAPPRSSASLSSSGGSPSEASNSSEHFTSPELETGSVDLLAHPTGSEILVNGEEKKSQIRKSRLCNRSKASSSHSPLSKLMSRKEIRQAQKKINRIDQDWVNVGTAERFGKSGKDGVETIGMFRELRV